MINWGKRKLDEIIDTNAFSVGNDYPFERIKYLNTGSITEGRIENLQDILLSEAPSRAKRLVKENDIIYSSVRPNQRHYGFIINPVANLVVSTGFVVISCKEAELNPKFLYYYLTSEQMVAYLHTIAEGSTSAYPSLKPSDIKAQELLLPPLPEQQAIVTVLSSLDYKIDLLQRQNQTLEALAQTLFRQWFLEEAQDEREDCSLYDAIDLVGGGTPKTSEESYWNGDINWLSGGDITKNHKNFVVSSEKKITELGLKNSSTKLLPEFSTVISARGTVGKYCILAEPMAFSQTSYGIIPKFENCFFFTYLLIDFSVSELLSAAYGSVFDTITTRTFQNHQISIPSVVEIMSFEERITPYFLRMKLNQDQVLTLEKLRDTLLPKLMSGEVGVMV